MNETEVELPEIEIIDNPSLNPAFLDEGVTEEEEHLEGEQEAAAMFQAQPDDKGSRKRKIRDNLKSRLDTVLYENKLKDQQMQNKDQLIQEYQQALNYMQTQAQSQAEQREQLSSNVNYYYEKQLDTSEEATLAELETAKENGDIKKEVEAQRRLAEIAASKQTQKLNKSLQANKPAYEEQMFAQPVYNPPPQPQAPPYNKHLEGWLYANSWADPDSSDFNPELRSSVDSLADAFNQTLKENGNGAMIGSRQYFTAISEMLDDVIPNNQGTSSNDYDDDYDDNTPTNNQSFYQPQQNNFSVAPVMRKGSSMADKFMSNNSSNSSSKPRLALSTDEYELAMHLAPALTATYGRHVTPEEAAVVYHKGKLLETQNRQNSRRH